MDATQAFRATAENSFAQAKEAFEKMSAATPEATVLIKNSYSTAVKGLGAWSWSPAPKLFEARVVARASAWSNVRFGEERTSRWLVPHHR
jgi:hypothetical protein